MFKNLIITALLICSVVTAKAQEIKYCSSTEMWNEAILKDPKAAERNAALRVLQQRFPGHIERTAGGTQIFTIPVVFHVMHTYGAENITKAQIQDAVDILNLSFRKLNPDTGDVIALFQPIFADCEIQFRLANIDPSGNCTDGITRTYTNLTHSAGDNVKSLVQWNSTKYFNVWVVANIASGAAGYAYYPGISGSIDGVEILHDYVGSIGTSNGSNYSARSLTHEVGHYLDLPHVWGGTNTPGLASNCNTDDGIQDTPNTIGTNGGCNTAANTCGSIDNVQNYMDYAACHKMFTEGQRDRMQNALYSNVGSRINLWDPANLLLTGTEDNHVTTSCAPIADFTTTKYQMCAGSNITVKDVSWKADVLSRTWIFSGGTPATDTAASVNVVYNTPGTYDITLIVVGAAGTDTLVRTGSVTILPSVSANMIPFSEGFETLTLAGSEWAIDNQNNNNAWSISSAAGATGTNSLRLVNQSGNIQGSIDGIITPAYNFSGFTGMQLTYKMAYAPKVTSDTSGFKVYVSTNCGRSWQLRSNRYGAVLRTVTPNFAGNFIPTATQWRQDTLSLVPFNGNTNIRIKFEFINHNGNNIYLDDINLTTTTGINSVTGARYHLNVYPNPAGSLLTIALTFESSANVSIQLTDLAGRLVISKELGRQPAGEFNYGLKNEVGLNGMYLLRIKAGDDLIETPVVFTKE